jgi:manganese/zinc/iron transport system substrate-binding protein
MWRAEMREAGRQPGRRAGWHAVAGLAGGLALLGACAPAEVDGGDGVRVVATTSIVADLVENVAGAEARVVSLMGPGIDPHLYMASEGDVRRLSRADLIVYNGLHLEARMADVLERLGARRPVVAVTEAVSRDRLLTPAEFEGAYDPHLWFDVSLWSQGVDHLAQALAELDPGNADAYRANAAGYRQRLEALDAYVRQQAERLPPERRVLVTAHDAFHYFGRAYGFEVHGLQGISTATEAGTADVQRLAAFIVERRVPAIFVETSVSPRAIEAVRSAVRARGFEVEVGGELYSDALGTPGTPTGSYEGMVRHNIDTIVGALLTERGVTDE